ncbi:MAG: hypothetical protein JXR97_00720 [Planctomycetes bacterium]|nr:hypothetical protein [Planctomycetota bacterium]
MAKQSMVSQIGWFVIFVMGFNFIGLAAFVGGMYFTGKVSQSDLGDILLVLSGDRKYAMSVADIEKYRDLLKKEDERNAAATETEGDVLTRTESARALKEQLEIQQQNYKVLIENLDREKTELKRLADANEALKAQMQKDREDFAAEIKKNLVVKDADETKELQKTLQSMDAADIALFLEGDMTRPPNGEYRVADYVNRYMKADFRAEVFTEMKPDARQKILPLLANKYAGVEPEKIADEWLSSTRFPTTVKAELLSKMPAPQALATYLRLDSASQRELVPLLLAK